MESRSIKTKIENDPLMSDCVPALSDDLWSAMPLDETLAPALGEDDLTFALDLVPQPSYPSPEYESESAASPETPTLTSKMDSHPVSSPASDDSDLMAELSTVNFADLVQREEEDSLSTDMEAGGLFDGLFGDGMMDTPVNTTADSCVAISAPEVDKAIEDVLTKAQAVEKRKNSAESESSEEEESKVNDPDFTPKVYNLRAKGKVNTQVSPRPLTITIGSQAKTAPMTVAKNTSVSKGKTLPKTQKTVGSGSLHTKLSAAKENVKSTATRNIAPKEDLEAYLCQFEEHMGEVEDKNRKNAIQARINREKKKAYIKSLEEQVSSLNKENTELMSEVESLTGEKDSLAQEVQYLKSVLANQSTLSSLLRNISDVEEVTLSSSFEVSRKRVTEQDHDYGKPAKRIRKETAASGGVCLHIADKSKVSVEFCQHCAAMATGGSRGSQV